MNSTRTQDHPSVRVPPPLIFFAFLGIASALEYWWGLDHPKGPIEFRACIALFLFGFSGYLALHAVLVLKQGGTFINPGKPTQKIVDTGPFRFSRHPMYMSLVLILLALSFLFLSIWFFLSALGLWLTVDRIAVVPEELYLEQKFGDRYTAYKSRVRRWI
jgi:protein-S-isoprenylcysteine O-methyltransferase Ste14